jgi:choline dehydrogenase-like flavoprotein
MQNNDTDILVIGSGAAGAVVTKRLVDLGAKVMCLEQGAGSNPAIILLTAPIGRFNSAGEHFTLAPTFAGAGKIIRWWKLGRIHPVS